MGLKHESELALAASIARDRRLKDYFNAGALTSLAKTSAYLAANCQSAKCQPIFQSWQS